MKHAYQLTSENRFLANLFPGITVDEANEILCSEQDLGSIGGRELNCHELHCRGLYERPKSFLIVEAAGKPSRDFCNDILFPWLQENPVAYKAFLRFAFVLMRLMRVKFTPFSSPPGPFF